MWMHDALLLSVVYQHSPWIQNQIYRGKVVGGRVPKLADAMDKDNFHIIVFKIQRFFKQNKCILKKYHRWT